MNKTSVDDRIFIENIRIKQILQECPSNEEWMSELAKASWRKKGAFTPIALYDNGYRNLSGNAR